MPRAITGQMEPGTKTRRRSQLVATGNGGRVEGHARSTARLSLKRPPVMLPTARPSDHRPPATPISISHHWRWSGGAVERPSGDAAGGGQGASRGEFGRPAITGDIGAAGDISGDDIRLERRGQSGGREE